jgi:UDP-2,3-diacylglucosamine hydrolase
VATTLFISDLHLDASRPATTRALSAFLGRQRHCAQLFILGDLFEAWLGDDDNSPLVAEVAVMLREFTAAGPHLGIMVGNRDFLLGPGFCERVGARLLTDPTVIDLYGEPTLLMHGDSLCTADAQYQAFRRQARDPGWQAQLLQQPLARRRELAVELRARSRDANSMKSADIMDVTDSEVRAQMRRHGVRQLIHGHTHRPARHESAAGLRWVLGAWEEKGWFISASPGDVSLHSFHINQ